MRNEQLEKQIEKQWDSDKDLREEFFGDFEAWRAFALADARGQVKILGRKEE